MNTTIERNDRLVAELRAAFDRSEAGVDERLHARLVERASADGLVDLAYRLIDSPIGPLLAVATPAGLVRIAFETEGHDAVLTDLAARISPRILRADRPLEGATRQLGEYFAGRRRTFDLAVDLSLATGFRHIVLEQLRQIPYGATRSYADVARAAGSPAAVRAVGSACSHNPVPVVVPCHRVVRSDGTLGGYLGGTATKRALLALEAA